MEGHSLKISDLLVNLKVPQRLRAAWPLVCAGEEIIWAPGLRQSNLARVTDKTRKVVQLALSKNVNS
jgi:tRNA(Ile)-lysidine synthase